MQHMITPPTEPWMPSALIGDGRGEEWEDTDAVFAPSVLQLYRWVPPHPAAAGYSVSSGKLVAVDKSGKQIAHLEDIVWK